MINLRNVPSFSNSSITVLTGGTVRFIGTHISGEGIWLSVEGYNLTTWDYTKIGWIHLSAFGGVEPCSSGTTQNLPIMDNLGNIIVSPTSIPPTPAITQVPPSQNPVCDDAITGTPVNLRASSSSLSSSLLYIEQYTPVAIYFKASGEAQFGDPYWFYVRVAYGVPATTYYGWIHAQLVDERACTNIPEATALPTNTPLPSATPTASSTPPPDLSEAFPLPLIGPSANNPARLSDCDMPAIYKIPSRDINPRGIAGGNHPVQTSARSIVMVVDRDGGGNPGVFVSVRIEIMDIPIEIRQRLATLNTLPGDDRFQNIPLTANRGALHIGYSHLAPDSIPTALQPLDVVTPTLSSYLLSQTSLGLSGESGNAFGAHLDVAVFYVPESSGLPLYAITFESYENPFYINHRYYYDAFWTIYSQARNRQDLYGQPVVINPLVLWPSLQEGTTCSFGGR